MPNLDKTGPEGKGPGTGRGRNGCQKDSASESSDFCNRDRSCRRERRKNQERKFSCRNPRRR